jgi:hypothetical protein
MIYAMTNGCPADAFVCNSAIVGKNLDCLKYAHEHGCGWNSLSSTQAAESGDLECFKYAINNGCVYDADVCRITAEEFGNVQLARWLNSQE